jgi:hypothetical protein
MPAGIYQFKPSYLVTPGGFDIFIYQPMAKQEDMLIHVPVPLPASAGPREHDGETPVLSLLHNSTSDKRMFTTTAFAMLVHCQNTGAHFLCLDINTYQKVREGVHLSRLEDRCLF